MFDIGKYNFDLDKNLIRTKPIIPADSAKLLIYNTISDNIIHDYFYNVTKYIPKGYSIYRNITKVTPARVMSTNAKLNKRVELLFMVNEYHQPKSIRAMVNTKVNLGDELIIVDGSDSLSPKKTYLFKAIKQNKNIFTFSHEYSYEIILNMLYKLGSTPLPKYITKISDDIPEAQKRIDYNSIFANNDGSIAAPTASLHFTDRVLESISNQGLKMYDISLSVGLGTFAPLEPDNFITKKLHQEYYCVPDISAQSLSKHNPKLAIGTTTVRALESWNSSMASGTWLSTDIFIFDNYQFKYIDALITNFHLPKSSLMCLVDSFLKYKHSKSNIMDLYKVAMANNYYFYSFGDAMLII